MPRSTSTLTQRQAALLGEVLDRHAPADRSSFLTKAASHALDRSERLRLIDLVIAEFCATGLRTDDEPNARGLELEALLDVINRPNLE